MAVRDILHKSKLKDFKEWLKTNSWNIESPKGEYEVLRATKPNNKPLIIFRRLEVKEHYSVPDNHVRLVYSFIKATKCSAKQS
jgi:hypothetical protein